MNKKHLEILKAVRKLIAIQKAHWMVTKQLFVNSSHLIEKAEMAGLLMRRSMIRTAVLTFTSLVSDEHEGGEGRRNCNCDQLKRCLGDKSARQRIGDRISKASQDFCLLIDIRNEEIAHNDLRNSLAEEFSIFDASLMDDAIVECCGIFDQICDELGLPSEKVSSCDYVFMTGDGETLLKAFASPSETNP